MRSIVGVIGPGSDVPDEALAVAEQVGALLADEGCVVLNGGLGGVMAAASRGAAAQGGLVIGYLPGSRREDGNGHLTIGLPTGLGEMRNALLVRASDAVICVGGSWGTLSEVALAVRTGVPLVMLGGWPQPLPGPIEVATAEEAVAAALSALSTD